MDDPECSQNDSLDAASEVNNQPDTVSAAQEKDSPQPPSIIVEGKDEQDVTEIKITTDDLFPPEPEEPLNEHKLGLDINKPHGWSGSNYDDYEYVGSLAIDIDSRLLIKKTVLLPSTAYETTIRLLGLIARDIGS
jgi:hypothetical protein